MKGLFIVLEGIDGSGTSTQASLLQEYFIAKGEKALLSPEPSNGKIGKLIREFLQQQKGFDNSHKFDEQMAYLFAADRYYHLYNNVDGVLKLIGEGVNVITTRYYFSSLAYNCHGEEDYELVKSLNQKFPHPDLVIYLDITVEIAVGRISDRPFKEVYENQTKLVEVRQNFLDIFAQYSGELLQVDGTEKKELIHQQIVEQVELILKT
ncbi:MAG: dTMP kinase [Gomphosphaeria aponina SAG 52.96 = DSM 107014]|uniref:Thymidylate kinase n=1 Tax=Gomphosphaeria aponina SAG 52.96 = DSM 107014 TaxID=1521640 RepID=A0A941GRA2_9CHRO|nr:dTMP kinase [Gomphosphaeria aponina SAG 52.96 = DSM 107014]